MFSWKVLNKGIKENIYLRIQCFYLAIEDADTSSRKGLLKKKTFGFRFNTAIDLKVFLL